MNTKRRVLEILGMAALLGALAGQAGATSISVGNAGFELPFLVTNGSFTQSAPPSWLSLGSGGLGVFNPTTTNFPGEAPEGQNVGVSNGSAFSQTLSIGLAANTTYTLTVLVGDRLDTVFPGYNVQLLAGSTVLSECDTCVTPQNGTFALVTVTHTTGASDPLIGQLLTILLDSDGLQTSFDDVRLDAVPEPTSLALLCAGLGPAAVAWTRRRRQS